MNLPEVRPTPVDRLLIGIRGVPIELVAALNLCRRFEGTVVYREKDVLVLQVDATVETIDELLRELPLGLVTHLWRNGPVVIPWPTRVVPPVANFCVVQS